MSSPSFTTVLLADGSAIKTNVNGRNFDGDKGSIFFQGRSISVSYNKDGMWEEVIEEKEENTELTNHIKAQEAELEKYYPGQVEELANLTNSTPDEVNFAVKSLCREMRQDKFSTINTLLMFHRTVKHQRTLKNQ